MGPISGNIKRLALAELGNLLRSIRSAAGLTQVEAGKLVETEEVPAISEATIRNWESGVGQGEWARQFLYLRELAQRSDFAARLVLQFLGVAEELRREPVDDDQTAEIIGRVRAARRGDSEWAIKREMLKLLLPYPDRSPPTLQVAEPPGDYGGAIPAAPAEAPGRRSRKH